MFILPLWSSASAQTTQIASKADCGAFAGVNGLFRAKGVMRFGDLLLETADAYEATRKFALAVREKPAYGRSIDGKQRLACIRQAAARGHAVLSGLGCGNQGSAEMDVALVTMMGTPWESILQLYEVAPATLADPQINSALTRIQDMLSPLMDLPMRELRASCRPR